MTNSLNGKKIGRQNHVAQILKANGNSLFYYTFLDEKSRHNFEIDFLLARNNKVCPIEIKSSGYKTHASLDAFSEKYSSRILNKYLVYTKDMGKDKDVLSIPVYMTMFCKIFWGVPLAPLRSANRQNWFVFRIDLFCNFSILLHVSE